MEENEPEKEKKPDVNYSLYADQPDKLFPIAQEQFNKNDWNTAVYNEWHETCDWVKNKYGVKIKTMMRKLV